jgi:pyruvate/2-oxoglutarate dehydrogenase complex dihydrolipoamide acyltransferase (E2) component
VQSRPASDERKCAGRRIVATYVSTRIDLVNSVFLVLPDLKERHLSAFDDALAAAAAAAAAATATTTTTATATVIPLARNNKAVAPLPLSPAVRHAVIHAGLALVAAFHSLWGRRRREDPQQQGNGLSKTSHLSKALFAVDKTTVSGAVVLG